MPMPVSPELIVILGPPGAFLYHYVFPAWLIGVLIALMFVGREIFRQRSS